MGWFNNFLTRFRYQRRRPIQIVGVLPGRIGALVPSVEKSLSTPGHAGISKIDENRTIKPTGLSYFVPTGSTPDWVEPQYDHVEVEVITDVEAYVSRATRAKLALFFREGFSFVGPNDERVEYIRTRIRQMERVTALPFHILLQQTAKDIINHSNAYWLKVRNIKSSGGLERKIGNKTVKPVAGYFPLAPETMVPKIDSSGTIIQWKQVIAGEEKIFSVNDIVHFYANRKCGYPLGVPSIIPVIDDIRALRSIEANVDILIHKHLFPLVVWKVGTDALPPQRYADGTSELDVVRDAVAVMPTEGSLVVPNRLEVSAVGVESKALRVETYLVHYRERVFAGLDVSSIDVGIADSSNRGTAKTLSRNIMDVVKLYQLTIQEFFVPIINELLLESTFSQDTILDPDNRVSLEFAEIDTDAKIAIHNNAMDLFLKNGITHPEMRAICGREPLTEEEEKELFWNKFGREEALIKAVDELSPGGRPSSTSSGAGASIANKNKPKNQHGTRPGPKTRTDAIERPGNRIDINPVLKWHNIMRDEFQQRWATGEYDKAIARADMMSAYQVASNELVSILGRVIRQNYQDPLTIHGLYKEAERRSEKYVGRLRDAVIDRLELELSRGETPNIAFGVLEYRAILIYEFERSFFDNLSIYKWAVKNNADMSIVGREEACDLCKPKLTVIRWNDRLGEERLPPFHPLCTCKVVVA